MVRGARQVGKTTLIKDFHNTLGMPYYLISRNPNITVISNNSIMFT
ncbi:hypothetical protein [Pedobacter sp. Leaf170]